MVDMVAAAVFVVGDIADIMEPVFDLSMPAREVEDFGRAGLGRWSILRNLLRATDTSGNLTSDAHYRRPGYRMRRDHLLRGP